MWFRWLDLVETLANWWEESKGEEGTKMLTFRRRLKFIKEKLIKWNVEVFKTKFEEKIRVEKEIVEFGGKIITNGMRHE